MHFVRVLRGAGSPMSLAQPVDALAGLHWIELDRRDDVRAALAALLVSAPDERDLFNAAFDLFWRDPDWEGKLRALLLPKVRDGLPPPKRNNRLADALAVRSRPRRKPGHAVRSKPSSTNCTPTSPSAPKSACDTATSTPFHRRRKFGRLRCGI